jgi:fused signal recognition particle receptor
MTDILPELMPAAAVLFAVEAVLLGLWFLLTRWRKPAQEAGQRPPTTSPGERLRAALTRTREILTGGLAVSLRSQDRTDPLAGVEEALVVADVGVRTTQALLARLREEVAAGSGEEAIRRRLCVLLRDVFAAPPTQLDLPSAAGPRVIMVTGVNGVGKTTTIGKLAARQRSEGRHVLLVAADTFRAAAVEQLERWAVRVGVDVIRQQPGADPAAVVVDGLRAARSRGSDVVIVDTAGRLHTKSNLMEELRKIRRVAARECPGAPHETLLVLDATTGQNGLQQARVFKEAVDVTGVVLTKMDGTARGGIAVAVAAELNIPVCFVGLGERPEDLEPFDADEFVDALLSPDDDHGLASELAQERRSA